MSSKKKDKKQRKEVIKRTLKFFVELCVVFMAIAVILYAIEIFDQYQFLAKSEQIVPGKTYPMAKNFTTVVLGEEPEVQVLAATDENEPVHKSENYQTKLISFGGNSSIPTEENLPLAIDDVKSELLTTRNQKEIKLYVSWKTNKAAVSDLAYGKNLSQGGKNIKEDKFGYAHSTIISSLDAASAYTYQITGRDKWGNVIQSPQFAFYTGAPNVSLLDLLLGAFKDVFGWAMKK